MDASQLPLCPVETTLKLIGDKWEVLILRDLMEGTKRFGQLRKSVGSVSTKVLTEQLRQMERDGLVSRKVYAEVPPRVEYWQIPVRRAGCNESLGPALQILSG